MQQHNSCCTNIHHAVFIITLNIFDFQYIVRDILIIYITTVNTFNSCHNTDSDRKNQHFLQGFQYNLNTHHHQ